MADEESTDEATGEAAAEPDATPAPAAPTIDRQSFQINFRPDTPAHEVFMVKEFLSAYDACGHIVTHMMEQIDRLYLGSQALQNVAALTEDDGAQLREWLLAADRTLGAVGKVTGSLLRQIKIKYEQKSEGAEDTDLDKLVDWSKMTPQ